MSENKPRKKLPLEFILIAAALIIAAVVWLGFRLNRDEGAYAVVSIDGVETARYPLGTNGSYPLNGGTNLLIIKNGYAFMQEADCPDKLCVNQGKVRYTGQCIVCLPNRVTVTVSGADGGVDLVS